MSWEQLGFRRVFCSLITLVFLFCVGFGSPAFSQVELPPDLDNVRKKISFLVWVEKQIPWLFQEGAEYDVDFLQLLESQRAMIEGLAACKDFERLSSERGSLVELKIDVLVRHKGLDRTPKEEWLASLYPAAGKYFADHYTDQYIDFAHLAGFKQTVSYLIKELLSEMKGVRSSGLITGLINCLPHQKRGAVFALTPEEQIEALKEHPDLTKEIFKESFDRERAGYSESDEKVSIKRVLKKARHHLELEMRVFHLLALYYGAKSDIGEISLGNSKAWARVVGGVRLAGFEGVLDQIKAEQKEEAPAEAELKGIFEPLLKRHFHQERSVDVVVSESYRLKEVPPYLGIFRGMVGGDCATSYSFPYPYAPKERTFHIYDNRGNLKGYLQGTEVSVNGESAFYLHDISGARLSVNAVENLLFGLYQARETLGFKHLVLPTPERIDANQNYLPVRTILQRYAREDGQKVTIQYLDDVVRKVFTDVSTKLELNLNANYDTQDGNQEGRLLELKPESFQIAVKVKDISSGFKMPKTITKKAILYFLLNLTYGTRSRDASDELARAYQAAGQGGGTHFKQRIAVAQKVASEYAIDWALFEGLNQALVNASRESISEYHKKVVAQMALFGVKVGKTDQARYAYLFHEGHLNASNSDEKTVEYAIAMLNRWPAPKSVRNAYQTNPELFEKSEAFQNHLKKLLNPDQGDLKQLVWLAQSVKVDSLVGERDRVLLLHQNEAKAQDSVDLSPVLKKIDEAIERANPRGGAGCRGLFL